MGVGNYPKSIGKKFLLAQRGSALAEYGLVLALVALAAVGQLQHLGTAVEGAFANFADGFEASLAHAENGLGGSALDGGLLAGILPGTGGTGSIGGSRTAYDPGKPFSEQFQAANYTPEDLGNAIEVAGSAGTVDEMGRMLEQAAAQVEAELGADNPLAGAIRDLAQKGYAVSDEMSVQKQNVQSTVAYFQETLQNNQDIAMADWYTRAGTPAEGDLVTRRSEFNQQFASTMALLNEYPQYTQTVTSTVNTLSHDVMAVSGSFQEPLAKFRLEQNFSGAYNTISASTSSGFNGESFSEFVQLQQSAFNRYDMTVADKVVTEKSTQINQQQNNL